MGQTDGRTRLTGALVWFETCLWQSRWLTLVAVMASLAVAVTICIVATSDVVWLLAGLPDYLVATGEPREELRLAMTGEAVKALDSYLLAIILLIFGLGLYELFIDKIDAAEGSAVAGRLLLIRSLDDLKHRLANVVLLKLIVTFFQAALKLHYNTAGELLALAGGIALVGVAIFLSGRSGGAGHGDGGHA